MRCWWVNQNQTFRQEQAGGYLWSPKRRADGVRHHYYETMREVVPGDAVLSFQEQRIRSIGIARSYCYESPKPSEFGQVGPNWSRIGWRVDVSWVPLSQRIRPADHIDALRASLPSRYSPLRAENGHGLQSVYLTEVPAPLLSALAALIGHEAHAILNAPRIQLADRVSDHLDATEELFTTWETRQEETLRESADLNETERTALILSRRGQGLFRRKVRMIEKACRVTRVDNPEHLVASHCKPWRHADNNERLDGENGLLLTPTVDHLFDRGFISFKGDGELLISPSADLASLNRMGIETTRAIHVGAFTDGQRRYLEYHRDDIFLKARTG